GEKLALCELQEALLSYLATADWPRSAARPRWGIDVYLGSAELPAKSSGSSCRASCQAERRSPRRVRRYRWPLPVPVSELPWKRGERTTIIRQEAVPSSSAPVAFAQGKRMSINEIYRASAPGVVHIETTSRVQQPSDFFGNPFGASRTQRALGSGFVIDKAGH